MIVWLASTVALPRASAQRHVRPGDALANLAEAVGLYLAEVDDPSERITGTPLVTSFQVSGAA